MADHRITHYHQRWAYVGISICGYGFTFWRYAPRFGVFNTISVCLQHYLRKDIKKHMLNKLGSDTCESDSFSKRETPELLTETCRTSTNPIQELLWTPLRLEMEYLFIETSRSRYRAGEESSQIYDIRRAELLDLNLDRESRARNKRTQKENQPKR